MQFGTAIGTLHLDGKKKGSAINFGIYTFYPNIIVKKVTDFTRCTVSLHCDEI